MDDHSPDILCFNEIRIDEVKFEKNKINDHLPLRYLKYWNFSEIKGYSGTGIFSKVEPKEVTRGLGIPKHDNEGRVITAKFDHFNVVCVYTPNSKYDLSRLDYRVNMWDRDF